MNRHVLLRYASKHQDPAIRPIVRLFLTRKANVSCSIAIGYRERSSELSNPFSSYNASDLHVAATFGLDWLVEELLQQEASVDVPDSADRTPLHKAAADGHTNVVKSLLEKGANPNLKDIWRCDAIGLAARAGHEPTAQFLLQEEALLPDIQQVINASAEEGHLGVLQLILGTVKDAGERAFQVGTALERTSLFGQEVCVRLLVEEIKDLEMSEMQSDLDEALFRSLEAQKFPITHLLLDHGADPTKGLHRAAWQCDIAGARHLLDRGANIEAVNSEGDRSIHLSVRSSSFPDELERMLELLLERGVDVNVYGSNKEPPLLTVAKQGRAKLVQQLLDNGADILAKDGKFNRSAIEWSALGGHLHVVQLLLKSQPSAETGKGLIALTRFYQALRLLDTNEVDSNAAERGEDSDNVNSESEVDDESSDDLDLEHEFYEEFNRLLSDINTLPLEDLKRLLLLHHSAGKGDETIVRAFIDLGADVEASYDGGENALYTAAVHGHTNIVRLLLDHGAIVDPQEESNSGFPPLSVAIRNGIYDSVQLLIERKADIERDSEKYGPPLMVAVYCAEEDIIRLLLDSGADPNTETACGHGGNALHKAVSSRFFVDPTILKLLIAKVANLEAKDHDDRTPLLVAVRMAWIVMVIFLLELGTDPTSVEDDTMSRKGVHEVDFKTAMQLIKDAKRRWIEGARSKSPSPSINRSGTKRKISKISD